MFIHNENLTVLFTKMKFIQLHLKDVRWLQLFIQTFFLHLFFASKIYSKTFNTKIVIG